MQTEQASLEQKNHELVDAFREKSRAQQQMQKLYQSLKAQVMASHVANAAGDEADLTLHTARADRFVDRIPGARTGTGNFSQPGMGNQQARGGNGQHNRNGSGSSGGGEQLCARGNGLPAPWNSQSQGHALGGRMHSGCMHSFLSSCTCCKLMCLLVSAPIGSPHVQSRSRLPVLGGQRTSNLLNADQNSLYQASPSARQPLGAGHRNIDGFGFAKSSKRGGGAVNGQLRR
jgi:hypothetical protein